MLGAILRKARQLGADPVLRRWLWERSSGRSKTPPPFVPHSPPYLGSRWQGLPLETPTVGIAVLPAEGDQHFPEIQLPGLSFTPNNAEALVLSEFAELETVLAVHRFSWLPLTTVPVLSGLLGQVWAAWARHYGRNDSRQGWAWHPYTAAERIANLLDYAALAGGLPQTVIDDLPLLAAHAPAIAAGLEWFGDHHTSNHCANNGRGLYLLGLALGLPEATEAGMRILLAEGVRLFRPSGVLREGSSHYHLLLTRQWASVWLAARRHGRTEAESFREILLRAFGALRCMDMPGRFPLIGDISPDCPPKHLFGLIPGGDAATGWTGLLPPLEQQALIEVRDTSAIDRLGMSRDGWLRHDVDCWAGLWHAEPDGWSAMPGHGHQDCGGAEIHFAGQVVLADAGRGSYAIAGEQNPDVDGRGHGILLVDGRDPYPQNRPYYSDDFRSRVAGPARLVADGATVTLEHGGFTRLGVSSARRRWIFDGRCLTIHDALEGRGQHRLIRQLITPLAITKEAGAVRLFGKNGLCLLLRLEGLKFSIHPHTLWTAYGQGEPAHLIRIEENATLPWSANLTIEAL